MEIALLAGLFIFIIIFEVPLLVKDKMWRELVAFSVLLVGAMALTFAHALRLPMPNPVNAINMIVNPISTWVNGLLSK